MVGGISGITGRRKFGFGSNQILEIETVLADGRHIKFGPIEWSMEGDGMVPENQNSNWILP